VSWARFLIPGPGQIRYQIFQNIINRFRRLGAPGLDSLSLGSGLIPYQILNQNVPPDYF
jgi:hypothetical protein